MIAGKWGKTMKPLSFGTKSENCLGTCHQDLQRVVRKVMSWQVVDFSVIEGHRNTDRQQMLFREGRSKIDGVIKKGKHNYIPSYAVDIMPYPRVVNGVNVWKDNHRFTILAGLMLAAAAELGIKIRWGGDWDSDGNANDQSFHDLPHFEILP